MNENGTFGWEYPLLEEVIDFAIGGDWGKDPTYENEDYMLAYCIRGSEFRNWEADKGKTASPRKIKKSSVLTRKLCFGDILLEISGGGPEQPVGRTVLIENSVLNYDAATPRICTNFLRLLRPNKGVNSSYLNYYLQYFYKSGEVVRYQAGSNNLRNLKFDNYMSIKIPFPPFNEQKKIVVKIEELFSELDKGIESLKTAHEQLKIYRQAVLKHAFGGKLTACWREQNKNKLESADQLLKRIQTRGGGNSAFNPRETADLPEIPLEWLYTRLENVGDLGRGKSKHRPRNDKKLFGGKYPFIQTGEIKVANRVVREYSQTYSDFGLQQSKLWPAGTLCITIAANIAETAFLGFDACFPDSVVGFTPIADLILPEYVELFIKSVRTRIEAYAPATAQKNINLTILENWVIPLCSLEEQREIVRQMEVIFTRIDNSESEIETNLHKSEVLRQSILKKAFSGKLVAQDPNDEPASVLLERIRAEKEAQDTENKKPKAKRNAA